MINLQQPGQSMRRCRSPRELLVKALKRYKNKPFPDALRPALTKVANRALSATPATGRYLELIGILTIKEQAVLAVHMNALMGTKLRPSAIDGLLSDLAGSNGVGNYALVGLPRLCKVDSATAGQVDSESIVLDAILYLRSIKDPTLNVSAELGRFVANDSAVRSY